MPNPWVEHVRKYAKENNISYMCAITKAKASYVKKSSSKPAKVEKEKNNDAEIKRLEDKAESVKKEYEEEVLSNILSKELSGKRSPKLRQEYLKNAFSQHNDIIDKLEKLTNKKYDRLDSISQIKKDLKKQDKRDKKAEKEKEKLEKLNPPTPNKFVVGTGMKKKKSGVLL